MSQVEVAWLLRVTIILPFPLGLLIAFFGGNQKARRILAVLYAVFVAAFNIALLNGFLNGGKVVGWGSLRLTKLSCPLLLVLNLVSIAAVLNFGFRDTESSEAGFLMATIPFAAGLCAMAFCVSGLVMLAFLWEGITLIAVVGLFAHGGSGRRRRLVAFIPWLVSDVLFLLGAVLCAEWMNETAILIKPPLTSGSEAQVVTVVLLFLASCLIRLGVFPFHFWIRNVQNTTDPAWNSFFLGTVNFLSAGFRLVVVSALIARFIATDWSLVLALVGLLSILAGPWLAMRSRNMAGYVSGMYTFQSGFLVVGTGLFIRAGLEGAIFCLYVSPLFLTALMMAGGAVDDLRAKREFDGRGLPALLAPGLFLALLVSGMSLTGLPPLDGFVGKVMINLGSLDMSFVNPLFSLVSAVVLLGVVVSGIAVARMLGRAFSGQGEITVSRAPARGESLAPLTLCAFSIMLGVFPRLLINNFIFGGSRLLFATGFEGPGIVFRGNSLLLERAVGFYPNWSAVVAAFIVIIAISSLTIYFYHRFSNASNESISSVQPFMGGATGEYRSSAGTQVIFTGRGLLMRGRG